MPDDGRPFPDVPPGSWYYNAVKWAKEQGIVNGYPDGTFRPNNQITRAEVAAMLYKGRNR